METLQQQTHEDKPRPSVVRRVATFFMWHTIGKHQVDEAIHKLVVDEAHPEDTTPETIEKNKQNAQILFARYRGPLQLDRNDQIEPAIDNDSSSAEQ